MVGRHGSLSVVLQLPSVLEREVGTSPFLTISKLSSEFSLVNADALAGQLATRRFEPVHQSTRPLPAGKAFWLGIFKRMAETTLRSSSGSEGKPVDLPEKREDRVPTGKFSDQSGGLGVAMLLPVGERQEHVKERRRQREIFIRRGIRSDVLSSHVVTRFVVRRHMVKAFGDVQAIR
jgi:hypothetical protein